ncbi:hypothetical protein HQN60_00130 [Deefgea piscis]|uniref:Uncharacterized protein n=1 Tax=Deefgea piscis TaxID=2739061 RepID=A0A6M8SJL3_9NEIS|nr:hypothetical protein [Deefgea piscis]QKJ65272.1 hypothetical protein HQN60_00130 [Deefgea piscis]
MALDIKRLEARATGKTHAVAQEVYVDGDFMDGWVAKIDSVTVSHPETNQNHFKTEAEALSAATAFQDAAKKLLAIMMRRPKES